MLIDVDRFKAFNDRHGHPAGDGALRAIGERWRAEVCDVDLLARIGGEEFGLLLPGCEPRAALEIAERLRRVMPDQLTASAGIGAWTPELTPEEVVAAADKALYRAKAGGRDRAYLSQALWRADGPVRPEEVASAADAPLAVPLSGGPLDALDDQLAEELLMQRLQVERR